MDLRSYRLLKRLSQRELARRLGVSELSIIKYENGSVIPARRTMLAIYRETGGAVCPNDFYDLASVALHTPGAVKADPSDALAVVGLMSGTSMDGIDAALLVTDGEGVLKSDGRVALPYDPDFRLLIKASELAVFEAEGDMAHAGEDFGRKIERYLALRGGFTRQKAKTKASELGRYLAKRKRKTELADVIALSSSLHAEAVRRLLDETGHRPSSIDLVGYHGQTLFHRPSAGITIQAGYGQWLADELGIATVYDFRANDVAKGGQGAPFAPIYHQAIAKQAGFLPCVVVNCGGIGNLTILGEGAADVYAFDSGPGNGLLDALVKRELGRPMDTDGKLALSGRADAALLRILRKKAVVSRSGGSYLAKPPPKSLDVNDLILPEEISRASLKDACATLAAFTAECMVESLSFFEKKDIPVPLLWIVAGGGSRNPAIMMELETRLRRRLGEDVRVRTADDVGWSGAALEAEIFAYLAARAVKGLPLSLPGTTGVPAPISGGKLVFPKGRESSATKRLRALLRDRRLHPARGV